MRQKRLQKKKTEGAGTGAATHSKQKTKNDHKKKSQPQERTVKADNMCNPPTGHEVCDDADADTMCNPTKGPWSVQSPKRKKAGSRRLDSRYRANPATKPTVRQPTGPDE